MKDELLSIDNLSLSIRSQGNLLPILQEVSFSINKGELLALVGESGSGKTVTSLAITRLLPKNITIYENGTIHFKGQNILEIPYTQLLSLRGKEISYIFQDPFTSLNPLKKIREQIIEPYLIHISKNQKEATEKAKFLLTQVGLTDLDSRLDSYPNQMSGGMLQRICIAMALMCDPELLIADEPTSALDVTIQAQLVDLLMSLKQSYKMSILFISHDLSLVGSISDRIAVMYAGQIVELATTDILLDNPRHPYTSALIESIPSKFDPLKENQLKSIEGIVPTPMNYPKGCHFSTRCEKVFEQCYVQKPKLHTIDTSHVSRCHLESSREQ
jgi:peptide/nickel transport system ATP-binding protein